MKHFISITDFTTDELCAILDRADLLRDHWHNHTMPQSLKNRKIALWFYGHGFRNRVAFELGARSMGADVSFIPGELGVQEPIEDIGHYLNNWFDMVIIRSKSHDDLASVAHDLTIPLINARTNYSHPCEIMGDLQFIRKKRGSIDNLNVVFAGEVTNLCMSWFEAAVRLPISVTQVAPKGYEFKNKSFLRSADGRIKVTSDLKNAVTDKTDLIYTDCWPKSGNRGKIRKLFLPYQITGKIVGEMGEKGIFLPCPPVTRGEEVSADSLRHKACMVYEAKEYLLHSQNAIMETLASKKD